MLKISEKVKFQLRGKMNHQHIHICGNENWYTAIEYIRNSTKVNASVPYHIFILFCREKYSDKNLLFGRADGMVFPTTMEVSTPFATRMGLPLLSHMVQRFYSESHHGARQGILFKNLNCHWNSNHPNSQVSHHTILRWDT